MKFKLLRCFVFAVACVIGLITHPALALQYVEGEYVKLPFYPSWSDDHLENTAEPFGIYMKKTDRSLYYSIDDEQSLLPFSSLTELPRFKQLYKFVGYYTGENGEGTQIINADGSPISDGVNKLPTELEQGQSYLFLYPHFVQLNPLYLLANDADEGNEGTDSLYFSNTYPYCGVWLNQYGEQDDTKSIVIPERFGYFFAGYNDSNGNKLINSDGSFVENIDNLACYIASDVIVLAAKWVQCETYQYFDDKIDECTDCPPKQGSVGALYDFIKEGDAVDIESCALKLNTERSACADGTNVVYKWNTGQNKYIRVESGYNVVPDEGAALKPGISNSTLSDYCMRCSLGNGHYIDGEGYCQTCPDKPRDSNNLYSFVEYEGGEGIKRCALKLSNFDNSACADATNVIYAYDGSKYTLVERPFVSPDPNAVEAYVEQTSFGSSDSLPDHCERCSEGLYNIGGECKSCTVGGYYLNNNACKRCTAGYYCAEGVTAKYPCGKDTYSEVGATQCTSCSVGYSTESSGPLSDYDGFCNERRGGYGIGCTSAKACKISTSGRLCSGNRCFELGGGVVKINAINHSVITTKSSQ